MVEEIQDMKEARHIELELRDQLPSSRGTNVRRTMISVLIQVTQPATGVSFMLAYGVYFFVISGSPEPFRDGIIVNCAGLAGVMISMVLMKKVARRPVLIGGSIGLGIALWEGGD